MQETKIDPPSVEGGGGACVVLYTFVYCVVVGICKFTDIIFFNILWSSEEKKKR